MLACTTWKEVAVLRAGALDGAPRRARSARTRGGEPVRSKTNAGFRELLRPGYAHHWMTKVGQRFGEHQTTSGQGAPFLHASLQGSDLTVDEGPRLLSTQSGEEVFGRAIGFGLEPGHHGRPLGGKGIRSRPPVARWPGAVAMRWAHLARSPRVRQTVEESLEIRIAMREHVDAFTGGEPGEMMLDGSNFI